MPLVATGPDDVARGSTAAQEAAAVNAAITSLYYRTTTNPTILIGTTKSKVNLGADTTYTVNGSYFSKATTADFWTLGTATSATTVAVGSLQRYALLINAAGNPFVYEATQVIGSSSADLRWTNVAGVGRWRPVLYWASQGYTLVGSVQVITDATHTFVPGTTLFDATGITAAFTSGLDTTILPLIGNQSGLVLGAF
jgi:hypothetical protein